MRRDRVYQLCDNDGCIEHFVSSFLSDTDLSKKKKKFKNIFLGKNLDKLTFRLSV